MGKWRNADFPFHPSVTMIAETTLDAIRQIFSQHGRAAYYGEAVTQYEDAAQAALLAEAANADEETVAAAFLHDIGHLLPSELETDFMENYGRRDHEELAAQWLLDRGFSEKTAALIANHVNAKRYLVYARPGYFNELSEASRKTLEFQGGPMTPVEADAFENHPYFEAILQMRYWDEQAKETGLDLLAIDYFLNRIAQL